MDAPTGNPLTLVFQGEGGFRQGRLFLGRPPPGISLDGTGPILSEKASRGSTPNDRVGSEEARIRRIPFPPGHGRRLGLDLEVFRKDRPPVYGPLSYFLLGNIDTSGTRSWR